MRRAQPPGCYDCQMGTDTYRCDTAARQLRQLPWPQVRRASRCLRGYAGRLAVTGEPRQPAHRILTGLMRALLRNDVAEARALLGSADIVPAMGALLDKAGCPATSIPLVADTGLVGLLPPWLLDQLVAGYRRQLGKNADHLALWKSSRLCWGGVIPFMTIKGLYLAQRFYGDIRRRFMSDVDIFGPHGRVGEPPPTAVQLGPPTRHQRRSANPFWGIHAVEVRGNSRRARYSPTPFKCGDQF